MSNTRRNSQGERIGDEHGDLDYVRGPLPKRTLPPRPILTGRNALDAAKKRETAERDETATPTGASLKGASREQLDSQVEGIRRLKAERGLGEIATLPETQPEQPQLPLAGEGPQAHQ